MDVPLFVRRLAIVLLVLVGVSCSEWLDVAVTNPCSDTARVVAGNWSDRPSPEAAREQLEDWTVKDNWVEANADSFVLTGQVAGHLPFKGEWVIVAWKGKDGSEVFRLPPSDVEPVPVVIPERLCPLQSM